uniref:Mitochondrial carrier protein n=1 Tax=Eutreptiella gymnastica TaxID=73025 RepID=A0A7S1N8P5_9EUGL|mmetsp:Transcript_139743/g.243237  ORF Transcript_139743/g.243237 Transcript_139743/m.243237 type:complete len:305 (+) Transcript_139743:124-1038(+)
MSTDNSEDNVSNPKVPAPQEQASAHVALQCALVTGCMQAAAFNPWDRALYLSVLHRRSFFVWSNWDRPFQGFLQAIAHRIMSGGCYFMLEDLFSAPCHNVVPNHPFVGACLTGICAGGVNGALLNPVAIIKYRLWGKEGSTVFREMRLMWLHGGLRPFGVGALVTVQRDAFFGVIYSGTKTFLGDLAQQYGTPRTGSILQFSGKMLAGGLACALTAPFNFARNIKYGHKSVSTPPKGVLQIWTELYVDVALTVQSQGVRHGLRYLQARLQIGWGSARVAMGMAFGDLVYYRTKIFLGYLQDLAR